MSRHQGLIRSLAVCATLLAMIWIVTACHHERRDEPCTGPDCCSSWGDPWGCGGCPYGPECGDGGSWWGDDGGPRPSADAGPTPTQDASAPVPDAQVPDCWTFTTRQGAICVACDDSAGGEVVSCTTAPPPSSKTCHELAIGELSCLVCHDASGAHLSTSCTGSGKTDGGSGKTDSGGCGGGADAGPKADLCSCP
jgi:hypothetical protein